MATPFIHLHAHSEFSALDGLCRVNQLVDEAKRLGMPAIAMTDHGNMAGAWEFYDAAKKAGIVPILGQEFYIVPDASIKDKKATDFATNRHIVMLATNVRGFHTLVELTSLANLRDNYYYKPRLDHRILRDFAGGKRNRFSDIIVTSACLGGEINTELENHGVKAADAVVKFYKSLFPNFYLELQRHPILKKYWKVDDDLSRDEQKFNEDQERFNRYLLSASEKFDVPYLITNDSHYATKELHAIHDMLLTVQTKDEYNKTDRYRFNGTGYYIKSDAEMAAMWRSQPKIYEKAKRNAMDIVAQAKGIKIPEFETTTWHFPEIPNAPANEARELRKRCLTRLRSLGLGRNTKYVERLNHELSVIRQANFERIFFIVDDYVGWARNHGIIVGPGRGSMVGVLVSYLLGITLIDPVRYNLLFERAINPARPSIPDFDVDFENSRIEEVIEYVRQKYGPENVMLIGTHLHMAPKQTIRSILRALGASFGESTAVTAELPDSIEIAQHKASADLEVIFKDYETPELTKMVEKYAMLKPAAIAMQGLLSSFGQHAAGVVISDSRRPLKREVPMMLNPASGHTVSQYDMEGVKHLHLIKFDFLRLSNLEMISACNRLIGHDPFEGITEYDDPAIYKMMASGDLLTIFQYQGGAAKQCIQQIGVDNFEDIVAVNAIARPGSIKFLPQYVENKKNPKAIKWPCKEVKHILETTYGIILYQEQVMQIVKDLAGWDDLGADRIKEATKSKSGSEFNEMKPLFIDGCVKNGISKAAAETIWANIDDYRAYGFNRAHAVAYSAIGYQTAFLKHYYPREWLTAVLNTNDKKNFEEIINEIRRLKIPLLLPDINRSEVSFSLSSKGIRFGFSQIRGIGDKAALAIIEERNTNGRFKNWADLERRFKQIRALNNTAKYMALKESGSTRHLKGVPDYEFREWDLLGTHVTNYPLDKYRDKLEELLLDKKNQKAFNEPENATVFWAGIVERIREVKTKKGEWMAFASVSWYGESWDIVFWPEMWDLWKRQVKVQTIVALTGQKQHERHSIINGRLKVIENAA